MCVFYFHDACVCVFSILMVIVFSIFMMCGVCVFYINGDCVFYINGDCVFYINGDCVFYIHGDCVFYIHGACGVVVSSFRRLVLYYINTSILWQRSSNHYHRKRKYLSSYNKRFIRRTLHFASHRVSKSTIRHYQASIYLRTNKST